MNQDKELSAGDVVAKGGWHQTQNVIPGWYKTCHIKNRKREDIHSSLKTGSKTAQVKSVRESCDDI